MNLKECSGCHKPRKIWKNIDGQKFCQSCAYKRQPSKTRTVSTRTISFRSEKRIIQDKQYNKLRKDFLIEHPCCVAQLAGCTGYDTDTLTIQHKRGRVGKLYLDTRYWITLCLNCHRWVNEHPNESIELGLAESRLNKN